MKKHNCSDCTHKKVENVIKRFMWVNEKKMGDRGYFMLRQNLKMKSPFVGSGFIQSDKKLFPILSEDFTIRMMEKNYTKKKYEEHIYLGCKETDRTDGGPEGKPGNKMIFFQFKKRQIKRGLL